MAPSRGWLAQRPVSYGVGLGSTAHEVKRPSAVLLTASPFPLLRIQVTRPIDPGVLGLALLVFLSKWLLKEAQPL